MTMYDKILDSYDQLFGLIQACRKNSAFMRKNSNRKVQVEKFQNTKQGTKLHSRTKVFKASKCPSNDIFGFEGGTDSKEVVVRPFS